jgi:hypothetical protein
MHLKVHVVFFNSDQTLENVLSSTVFVQIHIAVS